MKLIVSFCALALSLCGSANATIYTFEYTATVSSIAEAAGIFGIGDRVSVQSTNMPGALITVGDTVTGTIRYDSTMPVTNVWESEGIRSVDYDAAGASITANFSPSGFNFVQNSYFWAGQTTWDASWNTPDDFSLGTYRYAADGNSQEVLSINFKDDTHTKLRTDLIPGAVLTTMGPQILSYEYGELYGRAFVASTVTSLRVISAVPEPETYAMLLAGLALIGWRSRAARR